MHLLGQPGQLHSIQVRKVWDDHYRVNIFVGGDAVCTHVAHSYFLRTDAAGIIVAATPSIKRQY